MAAVRRLVSEAPFRLLTTLGLKGRRVKIPLLPHWWLRVTREQVQAEEKKKEKSFFPLQVNLLPLSISAINTFDLTEKA